MLSFAFVIVPVRNHISSVDSSLGKQTVHKEQAFVMDKTCAALNWVAISVWIPYRDLEKMAGRLVDNAFYIKLTEDQVRISLKPTFMYFPWFFILPPLLKSSQNFTFDGQTVFFIYYRKHPNTSLHLFVVDFTIWDKFRTFRNIFGFFFSENVILSPFLEIWYF